MATLINVTKNNISPDNTAKNVPGGYGYGRYGMSKYGASGSPTNIHKALGYSELVTESLLFIATEDDSNLVVEQQTGSLAFTNQDKN